MADSIINKPSSGILVEEILIPGFYLDYNTIDTNAGVAFSFEVTYEKTGYDCYPINYIDYRSGGRWYANIKKIGKGHGAFDVLNYTNSAIDTRSKVNGSAVADLNSGITQNADSTINGTHKVKYENVTYYSDAFNFTTSNNNNVFLNNGKYYCYKGTAYILWLCIPNEDFSTSA